MQKVYRLEHPKFLTPYSHSWRGGITDNEKWAAFENILERMWDDHSGNLRPDAAAELGNWFVKGVSYCGCATLEKLKEWFTTPSVSFEEIVSLGYEVVVYEVHPSRVIHGELQCIFPKHEATRL